MLNHNEEGFIINGIRIILMLMLVNMFIIWILCNTVIIILLLFVAVMFYVTFNVINYGYESVIITALMMMIMKMMYMSCYWLDCLDGCRKCLD